MEVAVGPFQVVQESFSSRGKIESTQSWEEVTLKVRNISVKDKELRLEQADSTMKELFVTRDMKCVLFEETDGRICLFLPLYQARLTCVGTPEVTSRLHNLLFAVSAQQPMNPVFHKIKLCRGNRSCPLRSEEISSSGALSSPTGKERSNSCASTSTAKNVCKGARHFESGLTPPVKKIDRRRSPNAQQLDDNKENQFVNGTTENNSSSSACVRNLSTALDNALDVKALIEEQERIVTAIRAGINVFYTGGAGTGKSTLLRYIIDLCRSLRGEDTVFVTATTGLAACSLQGSTLHQLFGLPAIDEEASPALWQQLLTKTLEKRMVVQRLRQAQVIIIDEISMLGPKLFEFMHECLKRVRNNSLIMGGVQIICCGDFFQLPPVQVGSNPAQTIASYNNQLSGIRRFMTSSLSQESATELSSRSHSPGRSISPCTLSQIPSHKHSSSTSSSTASSLRYCFQSSIWFSVFPPQSSCFILERIYRQCSDPIFADMLEAIRTGRSSPEIIQSLNDQCYYPFQPLNQTLHQQRPPRSQAQGNQQFDAKEASAMSSDATGGVGGVHPTQILTHKKDVETLNTQHLQALPGKVMTFQAQDSGDTQALSILQRHCPAKSQLALKVGAQVMLVKSTQPSRGLVNGARGVVVRFHRDTHWPVVRFAHLLDSGNDDDSAEVTITSESFMLTLGGRRVLAQRSQLPLDLAWAVSVHKAQGMTVDQGIVDVKNAFEFGQIYVALSRVRSREGLRLRHPLHWSQIRVDPLVQDFYRHLRRAQQQQQQQQQQQPQPLPQHIQRSVPTIARSLAKNGDKNGNDSGVDGRISPREGLSASSSRQLSGSSSSTSSRSISRTTSTSSGKNTISSRRAASATVPTKCKQQTLLTTASTLDTRHRPHSSDSIHLR